jgi:hypothetical protein
MKVIGTPLYQWEIGRQLQIIPISGMEVNTIHFSHPGDSEALVVKPKKESGMIIADIPNVLLQSGRKLAAYPVYASQNCCETIKESVFSISPRPKPSDYVYTVTEVLGVMALEKRVEALEKNGVSEEQIKTAVENYLDENPIDAGVNFKVDRTLKLEDGVLSVNTTDQMEQDNTLPMTSAGVYATVGNIEALLKTI